MDTPYDNFDEVSPSFGQYNLPMGLPEETQNYVSSIMPNITLPDNPTLDQVFNAALPALVHQESRGSDATVSPVGAKYRMQVMPSTAKDPGFGILPAQNDTPEEYNRVGREYFKALLKKYNNNLPLALAAYNAGPAQVDKLLGNGQLTKYFNQHPQVGQGTGDSLDSITGIAPKGIEEKQPGKNNIIKPDSALTNLYDSIKDVVAPDVEAAYIKGKILTSNYKALHETQKVTLTPQEQAAAKLLGFHDKQDMTVYKVTPEDRQKLINAAQEKAGLNPTELKASQEAAQDADFSRGDFFHAFLENGPVAQGVGLLVNPHMPASLRYEKIQLVSKAMDIVKDSSKYPKQVVDQARKVLTLAKAQGSSTVLGDVKGFGKEIIEHPVQVGKQLVAGAITSPVLTAATMGVGKIAEGAPSKIFGPAITRGLSLAGRSVDEAKFASMLAKLKVAEGVERRLAGTPTRAAERAATLSRRGAKALAATQKLTKQKALAEKVLVPTLGAGVNIGAATISGEAERGHVTPGEEATAALTGVGFGEASNLLFKGVGRGLGKIRGTNLPSVDAASRLREIPGQPGEPLPPESPINDVGHVPYTGGVSAEGSPANASKFIHIDKDFPDTLQVQNLKGSKVTIPVKKVVANVHEAVEYPLMHLTGKMSDTALLRLAARIKGEGKLTPEIINKLRKGESLNYQTAHKLATWAENSYVRKTFGVDPEVYQNSLKPFIKDITEKNKTEPSSNIPNDLDTKPYEDVGQTGQLKGRGTKPSIDTIKKGASAAALTGAGVYAYENRNDEKKAGMAMLVPLFVFRRAELRDEWDKIPNKMDTSELKQVQEAVQKARDIVDGHAMNAFIEHPITHYSKATVDEAKDFLKEHTSQQEIEKSARELYVKNKLEKELNLEAPQTHGQKAMAAERYAKELSEKGLHPRAIWEHTLSKYGVPIWKDIAGHYTTPISTTSEVPAFPESMPIPLKVGEAGAESSIPLQKVMGGSLYEKLFPDLVKQGKFHTFTPKQPSQLGYSDKEGVHINRNLIQESGKYNKANDVVAHEFQHRIQSEHNLPVGSSPSKEFFSTKLKVANINDQLHWVKKAIVDNKGNLPLTRSLQKRLVELEKEVQDLTKHDPFDKYQAQLGEINARLAESHNYTSQENINKIYPEDHPVYRQAVEKVGGKPLVNYEGESSSVLPENDKELVELAKQNNRQAIDSIFKTHFPRISSYIDSQFRNYSDRGIINGEDIASEAIWQGLQHLDGYDGRSSLSTWLHQIAKNLALNEIKANKTLKRNAPLGEVSIRPAEDTSYEGMGEPGAVREVEDKAAQTPEQAASDQEDLQAINNLINRLPKTLQDAYRLKLFADMSDAEIAKQLGISTNAAKQRIFQARSKFARWSQQTFGKTLSDSNRGLPPKQKGQINPELAKKLAKGLTLAAIGATAGAIYNKDHPLKGAWAGGILLPMIGGLHWSKMWPTLQDMFSRPEKTNTSMLLDQHEAAVKRNNIAMDQVYENMKSILPDKKSRESVTRWLDDPSSTPLTNQEYEAAKVARQFYDNTGQAAFQNGVLGELLNNYVNHEWGNSKGAKALQERISQEIGKVSNMSPKDRHALSRKFLTIALGEENGLTPRTLDVAELMRIYGRSMGRAMANKTLLDSLKTEKLFPNKDDTAIMPAGKAPLTYVYINHPTLSRFKVNPVIAPSLKFLFDVQNPSAITRAAEVLNMAWKRMKVSFSAFHPINLIIAHAAANPFSELLRHPQDVPMSVIGKSRGHTAYKNWYQGSDIDNLITNGLEVESQRGGVTSEDVKGDAFYDSLRSIQNFMDGVIPKSGTLTAGTVRRINQASDQIIWNNVHKGLKLITALNAYERMTRTWAKELEKNPGANIPEPEELARQAASFANDAFGGLNWRRLADDATTKFGREMALRMASPAARRVNQILLFAPDWTFSTIRMFTKAAKGGTGITGLIRPRTETDLRRQYILRSAILYATLYNALNVAMVGHPIWDNKDPLSVDLGNGETTPANKHFLEFPHLVWDTLHGRPFQFWLNKLGTVPKEVGEQALGVEYLSDKAMRPMKESRGSHLLNSLAPIGLENLQDKGTPEALASMSGFPIYGVHAPRTPEEKEVAEEKRHQAALKAARTRKKNREKKLYQ